MKETDGNLNLSDYEIIEIIVGSNGLEAFIKNYGSKVNPYSLLFIILNCLHVILICKMVGADLNQVNLHSLMLVFILFGLSIPTHEFIHFIAYKYLGADEIRIKMNWKKMSFTTSTHDFIVSSKEYIFLAFLPFCVLNIVGLLLINLLGAWVFVISIVNLLHNSICIGDISLINFLYSKRDSEVISFDDAELGITYFLGRKF